MSRTTRLLVTLDVERDYRADWRTQELQFRSVTEALPELLHPLLQRHGVRPTYLLGGEVLLDRASTEALAGLADCELGAHLHPEYVAPAARRDAALPDLVIDGMQGDLRRAVEAAKLATLTELFLQRFGRRPTAFRAGRFGAGRHTAALLNDLGYTIDSSVTPGVAWRNPTGELRPDYRALSHRPYRVGDDLWTAGDRPLLEVPVTIVPANALGRAGDVPTWFRPWYSDRATLLAMLEQAARDEDAGRPWLSLCMMFHSMELVAGASPYPQDDAEVQRFLADLDAVAGRARELGFASATLSEFEQQWSRAEPLPTAPACIDMAQWTPSAAAAGDRRVALGGVDPEPILAAHAVQPWFLYSFRSRAERWDLCLAYDWVRQNVPADAAVLDVGCGVGFNLHWLHEHGHRELFGCDLDPKAVAAARDLATRTGRDLQFWVDDGRTLAAAPQRRFAAICALNWIQLVAGFDLDAFLGRALALLADDGVLVFDFIDTDYARHPDHRHLTSDWHKPVAERRPSEYATRFHPAELRRALQRRGLALEQCWRLDGTVPRGVVACRRARAPAALPTPTTAIPAVPPRRPRVLYLVDAPGWAHERKAQNLVRCLRDRYDGRIVLQEHATEDDLRGSDLVVVFYWRQLLAMPRLDAAFARLRPKLLVGICSHNELEDDHRAPGLALLRRLPRAVFTHSQLLETEFRPLVGGASWCLPNGVDSEFFCPAPTHAVGHRSLRVGWAGSVDNFGAEMRGIPNILEPAVEGLHGVELVVAAREERLRTAEQMRDFYRGLDVYVCASRVEGTPNSCLEAAACGVPIVSTAVGNMPELLGDGDRGLLCARTPEAFAAALATLRDDPERRRAMGREVREAIEREWDWRQRAEGFAAMFAAVLAAPASADAAAEHCAQALAALARGDRAKARLAFGAALDRDGSNALAHAHLAALWWDAADPLAALTAIGHQRQAVRLGADDPAVRAVLADLLRRQGKAELATTFGA